MRTVAVPAGLYARLEALTVPLLPTVADVIEGLLDHFERTAALPARGGSEQCGRGPTKAGQHRREAPNAVTTSEEILVVGLEAVDGRPPRARGVTIRLDGHTIQAVSVSDMYKQALRYIVERVPETKLRAIVPLSTSRKRHLFASSPKHPTGEQFVVAVRHGNYVMEAHKDYKNAFRHLAKLTTKLGLPLEYVR